MTKRNPIPPGMDVKCSNCHELFRYCECLPTSKAQAGVRKQHYNYYRCSCGQPYISDISELPTRPQKENLEPDWSVPPALNGHDEIRYYGKADDTLSGWLILLTLAFALGMFCAWVVSSIWT